MDQEKFTYLLDTIGHVEGLNVRKYYEWKDKIYALKGKEQPGDEILLNAIKLCASGDITYNTYGQPYKTVDKYFSIMDGIYGPQFYNRNCLLLL